MKHWKWDANQTLFVPYECFGIWIQPDRLRVVTLDQVVYESLGPLEPLEHQQWTAVAWKAKPMTLSYSLAKMLGQMHLDPESQTPLVEFLTQCNMGTTEYVVTRVSRVQLSQKMLRSLIDNREALRMVRYVTEQMERCQLEPSARSTLEDACPPLAKLLKNHPNFPMLVQEEASISFWSNDEPDPLVHSSSDPKDASSTRVRMWPWDVYQCVRSYLQELHVWKKILPLRIIPSLAIVKAVLHDFPDMVLRYDVIQDLPHVKSQEYVFFSDAQNQPWCILQTPSHACLWNCQTNVRIQVKWRTPGGRHMWRKEMLPLLGVQQKHSVRLVCLDRKRWLRALRLLQCAKRSRWIYASDIPNGGRSGRTKSQVAAAEARMFQQTNVVLFSEERANEEKHSKTPSSHVSSTTDRQGFVTIRPNELVWKRGVYCAFLWRNVFWYINARGHLCEWLRTHHTSESVPLHPLQFAEYQCADSRFLCKFFVDGEAAPVYEHVMEWLRFRTPLFANPSADASTNEEDVHGTSEEEKEKEGTTTLRSAQWKRSHVVRVAFCDGDVCVRNLVHSACARKMFLHVYHAWKKEQECAWKKEEEEELIDIRRYGLVHAKDSIPYVFLMHGCLVQTMISLYVWLQRVHLDAFVPYVIHDWRWICKEDTLPEGRVLVCDQTLHFKLDEWFDHFCWFRKQGVLYALATRIDEIEHHTYHLLRMEPQTKRFVVLDLVHVYGWQRRMLTYHPLLLPLLVPNPDAFDADTKQMHGPFLCLDKHRVTYSYLCTLVSKQKKIS